MKDLQDCSDKLYTEKEFFKKWFGIKINQDANKLIMKQKKKKRSNFDH